MCPTVLAKAPYSACSDSVGPSDLSCDYKGIWDLGHVGWANRQPIYVNVFTKILIDIYSIILFVKKQPSQDVLHGDAAEEELGLARLVSSYTLPHQNSQPGGRGQQTARSKVLSRRARDT